MNFFQDPNLSQQIPVNMPTFMVPSNNLPQQILFSNNVPPPQQQFTLGGYQQPSQQPIQLLPSPFGQSYNNNTTPNFNNTNSNFNNSSNFNNNSNFNNTPNFNNATSGFNNTQTFIPNSQIQNIPYNNQINLPQDYLFRQMLSRNDNNNHCGQCYMPNNYNTLPYAYNPCQNVNIPHDELSLTHQIILKQLEKQKLETMLLQDVIKKTPFTFQFHYDCQTQTPNSNNQCTDMTKQQSINPNNACLCKQYNNEVININTSVKKELKPISNEQATSKLKTLNLTKSNDLKCVPDMATFMQNYVTEMKAKNAQNTICQMQTEPNKQIPCTINQSTETDKKSFDKTMDNSNQGVQCQMKMSDYELASAILQTLDDAMDSDEDDDFKELEKREATETDVDEEDEEPQENLQKDEPKNNCEETSQLDETNKDENTIKAEVNVMITNAFDDKLRSKSMHKTTSKTVTFVDNSNSDKSQLSEGNANQSNANCTEQKK